MHIKLNDSLRRLNYLLADIDQQYHEIAVKLGLSDSAMHILYVLCDNDGSCSLSMLYNYGISKQTVNSALRKLEQDELIYLEKNQGKNKRVSLTEIGKERAKTTVLRVFKMENEMMSQWKQEDIERYLHYVQLYDMMLKEKIKDL